ncbi:MAG: hypothetical protein CR981_02340 [Proteobacteria bacterium]|nr:MAG: hypothetical protein CR981_02340 [Pseudomonadota bacterium]
MLGENTSKNILENFTLNNFHTLQHLKKTLLRNNMISLDNASTLPPKNIYNPVIIRLFYTCLFSSFQ